MSDLRTVLTLLEVDRRRVVAAVLAGVGGLGSAVALAAVSAWLIARAAQMPPVMYLLLAAAAVRMFGVARGVLRYVERLVSHDVALRGMATLRTRLYERLASGPPQALTSLRRGDLLTRVGADVDAVGDLVVRGVLPVAIAGVVGLGSVVAMAVFLPAAGVLLAAALVLAGVVAPVLGTRSVRRAEAAAAEARAATAATALPLLEGADELRVAGRLARTTTALAVAEQRVQAAADTAARPAAWAAGLQPLATTLAVLGALVVGAAATARGVLDPVELAVVVLTPLAVAEVMSTIPAAAVQLHRSRAAARRLVALLGEPPGPSAAVQSAVTDSPAVDSPVSSSTAPASVGLTAQDLAWGWPGRPPLGHGLDLEVLQGRSVAVVGPSGVGKTTLLRTLAGELAPMAGSVARPGPLGVGCARTTEAAHVFDTTILENLRVARGDVTVDAAMAALEAVGLGGWARALPQGLSTMVGPDASALSGGERRRLLLARALLSPARVLLLDEPTEHLDDDDEQLLVRLLDGTLTAGRAVVVVTHRRTGLDAADVVIELGPGGSVVQRRTRRTTGPTGRSS